MDDSDPSGEKSAALTFAELVDQHASVTRILNSKLAALEEARKEIAELEKQKERALSKLLARMTRMAAKIEEFEKSAPEYAQFCRNSTKQPARSATDTKQEAVKQSGSTKIVNAKTKAEPAIPGNGQSEAKKKPPQSVPVKPWERHRCVKPYKPIPKRFHGRLSIAEQTLGRRVEFHTNTCTLKTIMNAVRGIVVALGDFYHASGGFNQETCRVTMSVWSYIGRRAIGDLVHTRTFVTLLKKLRIDLTYDVTLILKHGLANLKDLSNVGCLPLGEKQIIVNVMCFLGELQKHGLVNRDMIDVFSDALLQFDQNNCGFARRILAKLYKVDERGLWCISEGYSEDDENHGKPVTPPVTRIHLKPRELLPVAVDRGDFGKTLKSAPIELKTLVGWMFVQFPTAPRLDRDLTVFLNSISHEDLQISRYEAINSKAHRALIEEERSLLPEKMLTALVVRALTAPLESTSLYVRLLAETGKNFLSLGLMCQKRVEELQSESIFVLVHTVLVATIIWQRGGRKLEVCLRDSPLKVREKISKFFAKISEHGFYRVAWFLYCLHDHGKAPSSKIKDLRTRLCIDTHPNRSKFRLLEKWLRELDRSGNIGVALQESPLNLGENFGSSDHCRWYAGATNC